MPLRVAPDMPTPSGLRVASLRGLAAHPFSETVFVNADGNPYEARVLHRRIDRWCRKAGIPDFCPYALRHTFGSMEAEAGVNQLALTGLMGHTTPRTTARYVSNSDEFNRGAMDAVATRIIQLVPTASPGGKPAGSGQKVARNIAGESEDREASSVTLVVAAS